MSDQIGVLFLHGMGKIRSGYHKKLQAKLAASAVGGRLTFAAVDYQTSLQNHQQHYFENLPSKLRWRSLRKALLYYLSDGASIETRPEGKDSAYFRAQQDVLAGLKNLYHSLGGEQRRYIIIANSLGAQVMSNFLWDANRFRHPDYHAPPSFGLWATPPDFDSPEEEAFCRGDSLERFYTTGCNIPLFVSGRDPSDIKPFKVLSPKFKWHNYYDRDDVLGWPLESLNEAYKAAVSDHVINAGFRFTLKSLLGSFSPASHLYYWDDRAFHQALVKDIKAL